MFIKIITIVLCLSIAYADVEQPTTTEATISEKIDNAKPHVHHKHQKHHKKRGILSGIPPYKAGYDIPVVHHSFVKPLVVDYPFQRVPIGVKIPFKNPFAFKYPTAVGHHHLHAVHALKFPVVDRPILLPSQHLHPEGLKPAHHVHHHVLPAVAKPVVTIEPTPFHLPTLLPAPTTQIQFRPSKPAIIQPTHFLPAPSPIPVTPHVQNIPFIQQASYVPQVPLVQQFAVTPQVPYVIRPGNSVQTSYFATFPKHPISNFAAQASFPIFHAQPQVGFHNHVLFQRPLAQAPHIDLLPPHHHVHQALIPQTNVHQHQVPQVPQTVFNVPDANAQVPDFQVPHHHHGVLVPQIPQTPQQDTSGWTAITTPTAATTAQTQPSYVYPSPNNVNQYDGSQIPVYEQQGEQNFHNQFEQHHYDQHNKFEQEHQFQQQDQHEHHHQANQFEQDQAQFDAQQYHQEQEQQFHHHHHQQQLAQEYGLPPQQRLDSNEYAEGRNSESNSDNLSESKESLPRNKYHNHIPLGLQLPLKTPSDFN